MLEIADYRLTSVVTATFGLDGGAMFGVVPRDMWKSKMPPDEHNRITLASRTLIAVNARAGRVILTDTGCGDKWDEKLKERFALKPVPAALDSALSRLGVREEDVTDVIVTHLHFDHNGGMTVWEDGDSRRSKLRFPQATHWIHEDHLRHAQRPFIKDRASFFEEDFAPLLDSGVMRTVAGERPEGTLPSIDWFVSHGHTNSQLHPYFRAEDGRSLLFVGDVIPTAAHLGLAWVMAYDLRPLVTIEEKQRIFNDCTRSDVALAFPHDPDIGGVRLDVSSGKPIIAETLRL